MENALEVVAFQGAEDSFSRYLLPPGAGLFITHDEVLIVDAREMKMEHASVYSCFPHQTGVTERSISGNDRSTTHRVLDQMVISHQANWISNRISMVFDSQQHIGISYKICFAYLRIGRVAQRVEHPLEVVLSRKPRCREYCD